MMGELTWTYSKSHENSFLLKPPAELMRSGEDFRVEGPLCQSLAINDNEELTSEYLSKRFASLCEEMRSQIL